MDFEIKEIAIKEVAGIPVLLTASQSKNYKIISDHWITFNKKLKSIKRNSGTNWKKYGITFKKNEDYFYMPSVSLSAENDLRKYTIQQGRYVRFRHKGDMYFLKNTIFNIYKKFLPESALQINKNRELIHFEEYDYRFKWNRSDSIIDIYIPLES